MAPVTRHGVRPHEALTVGAAIGDLPEIENGGGSDKMEFVRPPTTQLQNLLRGTEEYVTTIVLGA